MNYVEMTTSDNFFVRQDVTGFFKMLHGGRAQGGAGIRAPARGGMGRGLAECGEARVCGGAGRGLAGWGGDSGPGRGVEWGFGPRRGVGIIWGKMGNFLPFCRFFAVWVEICGNRKLVFLICTISRLCTILI